MSPLKLATFATDWGLQFAAEAQSRGHACRIIPAEPVMGREKLDADETLFARLPQQRPEAARTYALAHIRAGGRCVQSVMDLRCYEDRSQQYTMLARWFPPSAHIVHGDSWEVEMQRLGLPLVSKARFGSSSSTVRALYSRADCAAEALEIFTEGRKFGSRVQYAELLWQKLLPQNAYAVRVARITERWGWIFKVMNRPHDWRASGSGLCLPVKGEALQRLAPAVKEFLSLANEGLRSRFCAADMLYDHEVGAWRAVDVTLAWNLRRALVGGNYDAAVIDLHTLEAHPQGLRGEHQWRILVDDLEGRA